MAGSFLGMNLPFGMSNMGNNTPKVPANNPNPNFPSKQQLEQQNNNSDPNNIQNKTNDGNPDPNNSADPNKGPGSQLDNFRDLFTIPVDDKGNPVVHTDPMAGPLLAVDPVKLREAASKMNFAGQISQEQVQKILGGDVQALTEVINQASQNAFFQAMQVNTGVIENAFTRNNQRFEQALPDRIRTTQIRNTATKHPALAHPAAVPMVEALKDQIARKNPHLSPDKVAEHAENYVIAMVADINNGNEQQVNNNKKSTDQMDWLGLLTGNQQ